MRQIAPLPYNHSAATLHLTGNQFPHWPMTRSRAKIVEFPAAEVGSVVKRTLSHGGYEAEFFVDQKSNPSLYHFIVTRLNHAEIVMWGQEKSMPEAERAALDWMYEMQTSSKAVGSD